MTTFSSPLKFAVAMRNASALENNLPREAVLKVGKYAIKTMAEASKRSGGVKAPASQFALKLPAPAKGFAAGAVVGFGFAVLDEHGSYKKPKGYDIEPQYGIGRGIYGKNRAILGNKGKGFAAAYVHHPPIKAHPYSAVASVVIGREFERVADLEQVKVLLKAIG